MCAAVKSGPESSISYSEETGTGESHMVFSAFGGTSLPDETGSSEETGGLEDGASGLDEGGSEETGGLEDGASGLDEGGSEGTGDLEDGPPPTRIPTRSNSSPSESDSTA